MVIFSNMKNTWKKNLVRFSALALTVLSLVSTQVVEAKTVSDTYNTVNDTYLTVFKNIYEREEYKNYIIFTENDTSLYSYTAYYLALTNNDVNIIDGTNMNADIDVLYKYYRSNNIYYLEKVDDKSITLTNSLYYTNAINEKSNLNLKFSIGICIGLYTLLIYLVLKEYWW